MSDTKNDEGGFKVVDRRLFTEEGELRKDAIEQERREQEAAKTAAAAQSAKSAAKQSTAAGAGGAAAATMPAPDTASAATPEPEGSRAFQMLVDFLTRNAAAMLGGMADPRTGQPFLDLEGARDMIEMLDVLREKTHGNLAKADDDLLIEVIGSLKLTYMEVSKAAADAMAKQAKGSPK